MHWVYLTIVVQCVEQGFLSAISEAYSLLHNALGISNDEIADIFESWNASGELKANYLISIGCQILHFKKGEGVEDKKGVVDDVEDKVVQDVDNSEGTGVWAVEVTAMVIVISRSHLNVITGNERTSFFRSNHFRSPRIAFDKFE